MKNKCECVQCRRSRAERAGGSTNEGTQRFPACEMRCRRRGAAAALCLGEKTYDLGIGFTVLSLDATGRSDN